MKKEINTAEILGFGSATPICGILNNCAAGVDAKSMCIYQAMGIRGDNPYACKITFKEKDNFIRGQIEVGRVEADDRFTVLGSSYDVINPAGAAGGMGSDRPCDVGPASL